MRPRRAGPDRLGGTISLLSRWQARLATRKNLLAAARQRHEWFHNAATRALLSQRKAQVAFAQRVVDRHLNAHPQADVLAQAAAMIAGYEGGQSSDGLFHPYWDRYGNVWTIGYGDTNGVSARSRALTKDEALRLLRFRLQRTYAPPVLALKAPANVTVALIDAVYNLGDGVLRSGALGAAVARRDWPAVAHALLAYDHDAHGVVLAGLQARRAAEARLILSR